MHNFEKMTMRQFRDVLDKLAPGEGMTIEFKDGNAFAVMPKDDFDHIIQLAGLKGVRVPS